MSYHTQGFLTSSPTVELMAAIKTAVDAHPAWEFVETVTSGANVADVYKCLATVSGMTADWYVVFRRTAVTGTVVTYIGEGYDPATKLLSKFPGTSSATAVVTQADGTMPGTWHVGTNALSGVPTGYSIYTLGSLVTSTSAFTYYMSVQNQCIIIRTTSGATGLYAGSFVSLRDPAVYPGQHLLLASIGAGDGGFVRDAVTVNLPYAWYLGSGLTFAPLYSDSFIPGSKDPVENRWFAFPFAVPRYRGAGAPIHLGGYVPMAHCKRMNMTEFAEALGDTVTIDGVSHVCFWPGTNALWVDRTI